MSGDSGDSGTAAMDADSTLPANYPEFAKNVRGLAA